VPCNPEPATQGLTICVEAYNCKPRQTEKAMKVGPYAASVLKPRELRKEAAVRGLGVWRKKILLELRRSVQLGVISRTQTCSQK